MIRSDFEKLLENLCGEELAINRSKGEEYIATDDALDNFKRIGKRLGIDPLIVWAVYFIKHIDAITNYVKNKKVLSEPIKGRIEDARLYLALLYGLIIDEENSFKSE